jgi:Ion channel
MTQIPRIPLLIPLLVGSSAAIVTVVIHALAVSVTLKFIRIERKLGRAGASFWIDVAIVALAILFTFVAHLISIALWAALFLICGEFSGFGAAYYHSAVNYTTLGYGDIIMSPSWRLLGPLEAANGALMVGVSTAMLFALIQFLNEKRLKVHG